MATLNTYSGVGIQVGKACSAYLIAVRSFLSRRSRSDESELESGTMPCDEN